MGKRSTKENKNMYQVYREELGLTREKASVLMEYVSADRIEKIESEKSLPHPDEILAMSKCYKAPQLCNQYCSKVCPIGQQNIPEIPNKELSQIVLEMLATLNNLNKEKDRLIEISVDGQITEDEYADFKRIQEQLKNISLAVNSLQLWIEKTVAEGIIDKDALKNA